MDELVTKTKWLAPPKNDARILGMPNIPKPLHGHAPRVFMGATAWDKMRKRCYFDAGYKCEVCGYESQAPADLHAHEVYDIDYEAGTSTFVRPVCLCRTCHLLFIHSGRALTFYKHGDPLYSAKRLLEGVEHGFKVISEWNNTHDEQILVYSVIKQYERQKELREPMRELIEKYDIKFYRNPKGDKCAPWDQWRLVYNGKEYPTKYKTIDDWERAMEEQNTKQCRFEMINRMRGGVFDEIDTIIKEEGTKEKQKIAGWKPGQRIKRPR